MTRRREKLSNISRWWLFLSCCLNWAFYIQSYPLPPEELDIPTSSSSSFTSVRNNSTQASLWTLPNDILQHIWNEYGYMDVRALSCVSKDLACLTRSPGSKKHTFHAMYPLPSVLLCIQSENIPCLEYWIPQLPSLLSAVQKFTIQVALVSKSLLMSENSAKNMTDDDHDDDLIFKLLNSPPYSAIMTTQKSGIMFRLQTWHIIEMGFSALSRSYVTMMVDSNDARVIMQEWKTFVSICDMSIMIPLSIELDYWHRKADEGHDVEPVLAILDTLYHELRMYRDAMHSAALDIHWIDILNTVDEFYACLKIMVYQPQHAFQKYVGQVRTRMWNATSPQAWDEDISTLFECLPLLDGVRTPHSMIRVTYMARFPHVAWDLGVAAVRSKRLDILTHLIREEGFLFFCTPVRMQRYIGCRRNDASSSVISRRLLNRTNFLAMVLRLLQRRFDDRRIRINNSSSLSALVSQNASYSVKVLRLVLENGGLAMRYPGFMNDLVRLQDVEVMRYVLYDLHFVEGASAALEEALAYGQRVSNTSAGRNDAICRLLRSKVAGEKSFTRGSNETEADAFGRRLSLRSLVYNAMSSVMRWLSGA